MHSCQKSRSNFWICVLGPEAKWNAFLGLWVVWELPTVSIDSKASAAVFIHFCQECLMTWQDCDGLYICNHLVQRSKINHGCFPWEDYDPKISSVIKVPLQGTNISHLGKRKIIFKMPFFGDMLVPWRVSFMFLAGISTYFSYENLLRAPPGYSFCPLKSLWKKVEIYETYNGKDHELMSPWHDWCPRKTRVGRVLGFKKLRRLNTVWGKLAITSWDDEENLSLGGGFIYFLFSTLLGEMIQFDVHIFQMGWNHQLVWGLQYCIPPQSLNRFSPPKNVTETFPIGRKGSFFKAPIFQGTILC